MAGLGDDTIIGGAGSDSAAYADAPDRVVVSLAVTTAQNTRGAGTDTLTGMENLSGSRWGDSLTGDAGPNSISGGLGNDTIDGGGGNDLLIGGAGDDTLTGGAGVDTVSYVDAPAAVHVNLTVLTQQNTTNAGLDTITTVENLIGSRFGDTLSGDAGPNTIQGGPGNDWIEGGDGNDYLMGGAGNDSIDGGAGTDTVAYADATSGVTVDVATGASGGAGFDQFNLVENLSGSPFNDTLTGDAGPNVLNGGAGTDTCDGGAGSDVGISCETSIGIP